MTNSPQDSARRGAAPVVSGAWRRSSYSDNQCVELAPAGDDHVALRNSNRPDDGVIYLTRDQAAALFDLVRNSGIDGLLA